MSMDGGLAAATSSCAGRHICYSLHQSLQKQTSSIMKHLLGAPAALFALGLSPAVADATFMLGGTMTFGANQQPNFGVSARLLENNRVDESTLGAGVTYYFATSDIGIDIFAGYVFDNGVFGFGYDLVQGAPVMSIGIADTED
jgi:hypothetical protein